MLSIARQRFSFLIASLSLFAFVVGNMVGQHGWYAFWKSVLGKEDDMIAFVGTVSPIAKIPDYTLWASYGGNKHENTFNQVPAQVLRDMPAYDPAELLTNKASVLSEQAFSTLWNGGYNSPQGSHPGVDLDAPRGTPVVAIANGIVDKVSMQDYGFGHHVMIRHPNVPDADNPGNRTTLYSTYAHMDVLTVQEGEVVRKGQVIGTVGNTGLVFGSTGYHLYFQVEKEDTPFHPYWPFTSDELRQNGMTFAQAVNSTKFQDRIHRYTLSPMLFVQTYFNASPVVALQVSEIAPIHAAAVPQNPSLTPSQRMKSAVTSRMQSRLAKTGRTASAVSASVVASTAAVSAPSTADNPLVTEVVKTADIEQPKVPVVIGSNTDVDHLTIEHSGKIARGWQKVKITAVDRNGDAVRSPSFAGRLYVVSEFGEAEIRPNELTPLDFVNGTATVNVLARSNKTLFISTRGAFSAISAPMVYER